MPYNPGTQYRGDAYLFEGISRAGASVGRGVEERKRRRQMFDGLAEYAVAQGYADKDTIRTLSLDQLQGSVRAAEMKQLQMERQRDDDRRQSVADAQISNFEADNFRADADAMDKAGQHRSLGTFWDAFSQRQGEADQMGPAGPRDNVGRRVSMADIGQIASRSGYRMSPEQASQIYKAMAESGGKPAAEPGKPPTMMRLEDGTPVVYSEQTGKWDFLPPKPDKSTMTWRDRNARAQTKLRAAKDLVDPVKRNAEIESVLNELNGDEGAGGFDRTNPLGLDLK